MFFKKLFSIIPISAILLLLLGLTACSSEVKKADPKPLTKAQVLKKVSEKISQQKKLPVTLYHKKEKLISGSSESEIDYYSDLEYHTRKHESNGYDDQIYQLPNYQYKRSIYEAGEKKEWSKSPYRDTFQDYMETFVGSMTVTGKLDDLKAQPYLSVLQSVQDKVQMKETATSYQLDLTSTDKVANYKWMEGYLKHFADVINPNEIDFPKYHLLMQIDKKTFAVQSIDNEIFFRRETLNLDNGQKGVANLNIQVSIKYPNKKEMVVPQDVIAEGDKNDPMKLYEQLQ